MPADIIGDGKNAMEQLDRASKSISVGIAPFLAPDCSSRTFSQLNYARWRELSRKGRMEGEPDHEH